MDWSWLGQLAFSVLTGAAAALVTARLSLGRFYKERWWEKKLAAYITLLEMIHKMRAALITHLNVSIIPPDVAKMMQDHTSTVGFDFIRAVDMGELLFSEEAKQVLNELFHAQQALATNPGISPLEHMKLLDKCQTKLVLAARRDLRVK